MSVISRAMHVLSNEMNALTHYFVVLCFWRRRKELVSQSNADHLNHCAVRTNCEKEVCVS